MATNRRFVFASGEFYHVFNRGVDRREIFLSKREYIRAIELTRYYRFAEIPMRFSVFNELTGEAKNLVWEKLLSSGNYEIAIIAYCFMPNHFHFLLRQTNDKGISRFLSNFTNGYTKYFNTKHHRTGVLFQGPFKAVHVETDEQLLHLTRYIHINPVISFLTTIENLESYPWSSLPEYFQRKPDGVCETNFIDSYFKKPELYREFVYDQIGYARELEKVKHLVLDEK